MINGKQDSYDIISEAVKGFWDMYHECDVVAYFKQKYDHEDDSRWCSCECIINPDEKYDMVFEWDFCEGQTDVKDITIVPLHIVLHYYGEKELNL